MAAPPIGLDIGSASIRAAERDRDRDGPAITRFAEVPLPPGTVRDGVINDPEAVTLALRHLWTIGKFGSRNVILGLTNPQVMVREMSVSNLPSRQMRKSLPFQVRDALPLALERSLLDFYPLEDPGENETVRGLLIAAPKEAVLIAIRAAERAGLHVRHVDLASFALLRGVSYLDEEVEAIVDLGAQVTSIIVHSDGTPLIVRSIPQGGNDITEVIAAKLGIPAGEAESLKRRVGLLADEGPETTSAVQDAFRPILGEIRSSFTYLTSGGRNSPVTRLALSGGGARMPGIVETLTAALDIETYVVNPIVRLVDERPGRADSTLSPSASVAVGLSLAPAS